SENCEETTFDQEGDFDILTFATKERKSSGGGILKRGVKDFEPDGSIRQNDLLTDSLNTLQNFLREERSEMWLYPEEALFLMERGALAINYDGVPMSMQHAYTMLIREWLTLEKYQVYAYLKRTGYTVTRSSLQDSLQTPISSQENKLQGTIIKPLFRYTPLFLSHITFIYFSFTKLVSNFFNFFINYLPQSDLHNEEINPIVTSESCDTYEQVFTKLQIIRRCNVDLSMDNDQGSLYNIDFHVYKQSENNKYKKKNPGTPIFYVVVACAESDQPPVLSMLENLFKNGNSSVLFAVVDGVNISFLEFKDINFININAKII
ncbi:21991_t:CDS:2, partial [Cetraspora pellucida]